MRNEDLHDLYYSLNTVKSKRLRLAAQVVRMGERRGVHRDLVGKPEGKRPLGRLRRVREDKIAMDPQE
jgi:hypothetical protein